MLKIAYFSVWKACRRLKCEISKMKKIDQKIWFAKCVTKCIVNLPSILNVLCETLNFQFNGIKFKNTLLTKFSVKLKWNFEGFSAFSLKFHSNN